jgi:hypothetical protein
MNQSRLEIYTGLAFSSAVKDHVNLHAQKALKGGGGEEERKGEWAAWQNTATRRRSPSRVRHWRGRQEEERKREEETRGPQPGEQNHGPENTNSPSKRIGAARGARGGERRKRGDPQRNDDNHAESL